MSNPSRNRNVKGNVTKATSASGSTTLAVLRAAKRRVWYFRLFALLIVPVVFLALVELVLRLTGFGYPTAFLLSESQSGQKVFVQNNRFGWRLFGPELSRVPHPFSIPVAKQSNTVRVIVFGESAAYGDPQPWFGLARMLEAILSLRHPGTRFEVVNAAMTGISSHGIVAIARDCTRANADIWVIYMGNNDVVGPFGAGTVFGPQSPPLPLIRASLALKTMRTGQLLDSIGRGIKKVPAERSEWGGMAMFLSQQVRADDPRMRAVYKHFERNLADIIRAGRRAGTKVVVSTVAVNLRDCAPFASAHRPGLSEADMTRWANLYKAGVEAQVAGRTGEAAERFRQAAQIDDTVAELRFRQGVCALESGAVSEAQQHFRAARDFDTLRFRCDSRLNELTRQTALQLGDGGVLLADAEAVFAEQSPGGLPGNEFFYDHVHFTFAGNYLLASNIAVQIEKLIPDQTAARTADSRPWPSVEDCARRLGWSHWALQAVLTDMLSRLQDAPFTLQLNHAAQLQHIMVQLQKLSPATQPAGLGKAQDILLAALGAAPDDPWLHAQLAQLKQLTGDLAGAVASAQRVVELVPSSSEAWSRLGLLQVRQQQYDKAVASFRRAFELDSQDVWALHNLAQTLAKLGRHEEAIYEFKRAVAIKPRFGPAWLGLGLLLEGGGRKAEAQQCFERALTNRIRRASELAMLARFCKSRGWLEAAVTNYTDAISLAPLDPQLHMEAAQCLDGLGRQAEAVVHYAKAVGLAPELVQARFLYGLSLGRQGKATEAEEQFREAVRLMPELVEARLNLGIALAEQRRFTEALAEFEEVLTRSPTNPVALKWCEIIRGRLNSPGGP